MGRRLRFALLFTLRGLGAATSLSGRGFLCFFGFVARVPASRFGRELVELLKICFVKIHNLIFCGSVIEALRSHVWTTLS